MGGLGSGRSRSSHFGTVEGVPVIDVNRLHRRGALRPGLLVTFHYGEKVAIECGVTAEAGPDFRPSIGTISSLHLPGGPAVRVDTHVYQGYTIPAHYDSLLAKIMVHGEDRQEAIMRMRRALAETRIEGVPNTVDYLRTVLDDTVFRSGQAHTDYVLVPL